MDREVTVNEIRALLAAPLAQVSAVETAIRIERIEVAVLFSHIKRLVQNGNPDACSAATHPFVGSVE